MTCSSPAGAAWHFLTDPFKDGEGWCTELNLPHGVTAGAILKRREELASGLRRPLSAVWPEGVPAEHEGRLKLWIGFTDMAKMKPKPWPLAKSGKADVFDHVPFGTDPRGRTVTVPAVRGQLADRRGARPGQDRSRPGAGAAPPRSTRSPTCGSTSSQGRATLSRSPRSPTGTPPASMRRRSAYAAESLRDAARPS